MFVKVELHYSDGTLTCSGKNNQIYPLQISFPFQVSETFSGSNVMKKMELTSVPQFVYVFYLDLHISPESTRL